MAFLPATQRQVPEHAILDYFNKQTYLGNQYVATLASTVGTGETNLLVEAELQVEELLAEPQDLEHRVYLDLVY